MTSKRKQGQGCCVNLNRAAQARSFKMDIGCVHIRLLSFGWNTCICGSGWVLLGNFRPLAWGRKCLAAAWPSEGPILVALLTLILINT